MASTVGGALQQRTRHGSSTVSRPRGSQRRRRRVDNSLWALLFIGPTAAGLGVFYIWPAVQTFYYSFTAWGAFGGHAWNGLANYSALLQDLDVKAAFVNTFWFALLGLLGLPVSLVLAAVFWISDPHTARLAVAAVGIWSTVGYNMVILMAGLQAISPHYYEAAAMDGAGPVRQFFSITIPLLSPSLFFVTVLSVIGSLQTFDLVYVMIGQTNPALPQTRTVVYLFYQKAFIENDRGYAAALAFILLLVIMAVTAVQFRLQKRWVHYE